MDLLKFSLDKVMVSYYIGYVLSVFWISTAAASYLNQPDQFCEFESMTASCQPDEVVVMNTARYGRMSLGRCVQADLGYVGCSANVLDIADQLCSGRRQCSVSIPNQPMKAKAKCLLKDLTSYLTASFSCYKAISIDQNLCRQCDFVRVSEPFGVIASVVTQESKCGSTNCPWLITVPVGQKINITLVNFNWGPERDALLHNGFAPEYSCRTVLATLKEAGKGGPKTICSDRERERHIYTSSSNKLEIRIVDRMREGRPLHFLLKYQAIGCVDPLPPDGGWITRMGDEVTAGCNESIHTAQWICTDNKWEGKMLECGSELKSPSAGYVKVGSVSLSIGWSVTVIVGLAIVIGLFILTGGLVIAKRRRARRHVEEPIYQPPPYLAPNYRDPPPYCDKTANQSKQCGPREENGYTHIWQRPLPDKPGDSAHTLPHTDPAYVQEPGSVHYGYNSIASVPRGNPKPTKSRDTSSFAMSALKDNTRNNNPSTTQDCRYFQLDQDRMSNHVSA